jgi:hypothetical protein
MAWEPSRYTKWGVCWKWGFIPYPCRKTYDGFCCTGTAKQTCYGFVASVWFCCNGKEHHYWKGCFGAGTAIYQERRCVTKVPTESEGCGHVVGDAPPGISTG